jgi:cystathionine beta-synthase
MDQPFTFVGLDNTVDVLASLINKDNTALLVRDEKNLVHIITQSDLLMAINK